MKLLLEKNDMETYSTYNEGKFVIAERFIRTVKKQYLSIHDFSFKGFLY